MYIMGVVCKWFPITNWRKHIFYWKCRENVYIFEAPQYLALYYTKSTNKLIKNGRNIAIL